MSIEGMLCAAGLALLAAGVLVRAHMAPTSTPASAAVTDPGPPRGEPRRSLGERSPLWWVGTAALWLGTALLMAAGGVMYLQLMLFSVAS